MKKKRLTKENKETKKAFTGATRIASNIRWRMAENSCDTWENFSSGARYWSWMLTDVPIHRPRMRAR